MHVVTTSYLAQDRSIYILNLLFSVAKNISIPNLAEKKRINIKEIKKSTYISNSILVLLACRSSKTWEVLLIC
jgi:hypothetical protein